SIALEANDTAGLDPGDYTDALRVDFPNTGRSTVWRGRIAVAVAGGVGQGGGKRGDGLCRPAPFPGRHRSIRWFDASHDRGEFCALVVDRGGEFRGGSCPDCNPCASQPRYDRAVRRDVPDVGADALLEIRRNTAPSVEADHALEKKFRISG